MDYSLSCDSGAIVLTGTAVVLKSARKLAAANGSITLSGTAVVFIATRKLSLSSGVLVLDGRSVGLSDSRFASFFLNSKSSIVQLETLEISHSKFTQTYYVVRNSVAGITATLEDSTSHFFQYYPLSITPVGANDDLDQSLKIALGDLGEVLPLELDAVTSQNGFGEKPIVKYRTYRSDNLTIILFGPLILEVSTFTFNREGSSFEAKAPSLNINRTGELYTLDRFPMMRGFL